MRLGILGGGQLGRMMVMAAARLGIECHIYNDKQDCAAAQIAPFLTVAPFDLARAAPSLREFAASVDVVTYEFEHLPLDLVEYVAGLKPVYPSPAILRITQHRIHEKNFINECGIETAPWGAVHNFEDLQHYRQHWPLHDTILKTSQMGYDGKGQVRISTIAAETDASALAKWQIMAGGRATKAAKDAPAPFIAEQAIDFQAECSVIIARTQTGAQTGSKQSYPLVENRHKNHILAASLVPIRRDLAAPALAARAQEIAEILAERLDLVGLLAVEMFLTKDQQILVNELAPRPHNSGHWSLDGCITSQFEQTIRAVCGLPLGAVDVVWPQNCSPATHQIVMENLLGDAVQDWQQILADPMAKLHLYGKNDPAPGRKMGHVTRFVKI